MERHFSTSDAVGAGGGGLVWLVSAFPSIAEKVRDKGLSCREGTFEPAEEALARRKRRLRPAVNESRQMEALQKHFCRRNHALERAVKQKQWSKGRKEGDFGKTFQHVRCSGCGGGGISLACVCFPLDCREGQRQRLVLQRRNI